jgi:cytochrome c5
MKRSFSVFVIIAIFMAAALTYAAPGNAVHSIELPEITVELKAGDGKETTERFCGICHSLDYVTMQPPFSRAQWTATVNKMIKVMGAPIAEGDAKTIINYLAVEYGTGK